MTGGLTYLLCHDAEEQMHQHLMNHYSVRFAALEAQEEQWLRRLLHRHVQLTGSPRAADFLSYSALPLLRVEPLMPACSVKENLGADSGAPRRRRSPEVRTRQDCYLRKTSRPVTEPSPGFLSLASCPCSEAMFAIISD